MLTLKAKIISGIVSLLFVIGLLLGAKWVYDKLKEQSATIADLQSNAQSAAEISDEASTEVEGRTVDVQRVTETRIEYRTKYEVLRDANPTVAAFDAMHVPLELRKLACERRVARDLNGPTAPSRGCERFDGEAGDSGRSSTD